MRGLLQVILVLSTVWAVAARAEGAPKSWREKMGALSQAISEAIPFLYPDPNQDAKGLTEKVKKVFDVTKELGGKWDHGTEIPDSGDPALPYIANLFQRDIEIAYKSLEEGHAEYAKGILRNSVSYCIACHTRTRSGADFPLVTAFEERMKKASWIDKIEFQTAIRQFDPAISDVMGKLKDPSKVVSPLDLERGAKIALAIAVRYKKDPERAVFLAKSVGESPNATLSMKEASKKWLSDLREWQDEKKKSYESDKELLQAARDLIKKVGKATAPAVGHNEVRFLRASHLMHDLLRQYPKSPYTAEALYIIGSAYDSLEELGLWSLNEMYFMACIEKAPHSDIAMSCYKKYEENVTLGYSGSRGVNIPSAVSSHLKSLKEQAEPARKKM